MTEEAKPFLQWVGGKSRLLRDLSMRRAGRFMLSNSDCPDGFFYRLYSDYVIDRGKHTEVHHMSIDQELCTGNHRKELSRHVV